MNTRSLETRRRDWRLATTFAFTALGCAVLLGGLSAWFLGSVALAGLTTAALTFNFHIPAALVRLFALGRVAARYGERLVGHRAALGDQVARRVDLFSCMAAAPGVRRAGWQLGDPARLADYLDDVEDVDYARLRAGLPFRTLTVGFTALILATAWLAPLALVPVGVLLAAGAFLVRRLKREGTAALATARAKRNAGAQEFGAALAAGVPLKAEGQWAACAHEALATLDTGEHATGALRRAQVPLDTLSALAGPLVGASAMLATWFAGLRGGALLASAFLAFAWLAFGESVTGASRIVVALLRRKAAAEALDLWSETKHEAVCVLPEPTTASLCRLGHAGLQRLSPAGLPLGTAPLALSLTAGVPTILKGASGSGKTSLLKQIAGWIGEDRFAFDGGILDAYARCAVTTLVLHDAAVLEDTVRANLFATDQSDVLLWQALEATELDARIKAAGGLDAWLRQDTLSLGEAQRLNLARAWLSTKPIVLLDEPAEHLDTGQGERILKGLAEHLRERIVVVAAHHDVPALTGVAHAIDL
ncbi:ATP-binding cassette domain-containing protein [Pararhizobium mangrovi]|uniref:ATP-binding cassette domain-containing protein n=1 Tax=Pararhizobium mangrovi TaxID=2590452 RepID=A0A506UFD9_9HYPH|nr:ATP-binding cassette domain-containing protein [Pararhizobium mangrovi]TPW31971.1 ATP-binding cassette domain-containing protein [Pararhizobium mangrovi]